MSAVENKRKSRPKAIKWEAELLQIIERTENVRSFRFAKPDGWTFIPGQFIMVIFPEKFGKQNRAYSISSSPNDDYIELTIKLYGLFTHHMWTLEEGSIWTLRGAYGRFFIDMELNNDIMLVGAGVGITPLMSMLKWATEVKSERKFLLLYSNRTPHDIVFKEELDEIEQNNPNVHIVHTITRLSTCSPKEANSWYGLQGRIKAAMIIEQLQFWESVDDAHPSVFGCGPAAMLEAMEVTLLELGWPKEEIHYEKFW